ncbi:hypothetical protein T4D_14316 [Trichinella pseudospiralis]|uniref:Uncharacterized protein n=1 Tax=Trichinella pseudospiralis TaxID=6337 RepID=A0A0V1FYK6_TRIPS|nr:hypothetical protein T4D_14316 [Trichinella pseudospiralis]
MPFGLCNAPGTEEERLFRLKEVFQRKRPVYLRHVITSAGIGTYPQKTAASKGGQTIPGSDVLLPLSSYILRHIVDT